MISFYSGEAGNCKEAGTGKPLFLRLPILCNFKSSSSWWSWIVATFSKIAAAIMLPYVSVHVTLTSGWKLSWLSVSSWLSKMVKKLFSQKKSLSADLWLYLKFFRMHWVNSLSINLAARSPHVPSLDSKNTLSIRNLHITKYYPRAFSLTLDMCE